MTDREFKLELSKVALANGMSVESAKMFYDWIMAEPDREVPSGEPTPWDNIPIEDFACKMVIEGTVNKRCKDNGINTVGDLVRCGGHKFKKFKNVGDGTLHRIANALYEEYGIDNWYPLQK